MSDETFSVAITPVDMDIKGKGLKGSTKVVSMIDSIFWTSFSSFLIRLGATLKGAWTDYLLSLKNTMVNALVV